jgi:hypothetical protein
MRSRDSAAARGIADRRACSSSPRVVSAAAGSPNPATEILLQLGFRRSRARVVVGALRAAMSGRSQRSRVLVGLRRWCGVAAGPARAAAGRYLDGARRAAGPRPAALALVVGREQHGSR